MTASLLNDRFVRRHNGADSADIAHMLGVIKCASIEELIDGAMPKSIRQVAPNNLPTALNEREALAHLRALADRNQIMTSMIGQGYHDTILPPVILRNVLENPAWYTAYTPYQPEISQGRLEALINFQTALADLAGLDLANASLLDEGTAAAEAMAMAYRATKGKRNVFFVDENTHPQTIAILKTRADPLEWSLQIGDAEKDLDASVVFGALLQYPGTDGAVPNIEPTISLLHDSGAIACVAADPMALVLLKSPGEMGADIVVGSTQRFGVPMGFGGPHAAYMACTDKLKRLMPGRLIGVSIDSRGKPAYRLSLQTREQHIRREKATSNICTAQVLLAVIASMYLVYHGPEGVIAIAKDIARKAGRLHAGLKAAGVKILNNSFFDTVTVDVDDKAGDLLSKAQRAGINLRNFGGGRLGLSVDEVTSEQAVDAVLAVFGATPAAPVGGVPANLRRTSAFMTHPTFHAYRTETELLRYIRRLADRDLALDRAMIPLGSCTMKLNATTEMIPVTWPEFSNIHPFAPNEQVAGYLELITTLGKWLAEVTGYDATSMQPNSGAQGEFAGLMAIRAYHQSRGDADRDICLIPASSHGTNPASANMAGMEVIVVKCDDKGNVDVADLEDKATQYADRLAAIMITYPSTHGVFEEEIVKICDLIHANGGQVYLDGANLNAQLGVARPGDYGADVSHLNLHKTFCIPHGGGGPGMGPIVVKKHLAPFLPGHVHLDGGDSPVGAVSAAPYSSASILPISYAFILMMGAEGLQQATELAILNANYMAERLEPHFPVLYRNQKGRVAHECIIDPRGLKEKTGVSVDDIAKRLMDYGFHAPTMSFPVPGTLMIEPTESESLVEIDRFIDAMIAIRGEILQIEQGAYTVEQSPLRHAPHTVVDLVQDDWDRPYSRQIGCLPANQGDKYWTPVNRVDNAYGDRNLVCSCPPIEEYQQAAE